MISKEKLKMLYGGHIKISERDGYAFIETSKGECQLVYEYGRVIKMSMVKTVHKISDNVARFECETGENIIVHLDTGKHERFKNTNSVNDLYGYIMVYYNNKIMILDNLINKVSSIKFKTNNILSIKIAKSPIIEFGNMSCITALTKEFKEVTIYFSEQLGAVDFETDGEVEIKNYNVK